MSKSDAPNDRLDEAARALAERLPSLDVSLDDAIMAAVRRRVAVAAPPVKGIRWLFEPRPVRVRPVWIPIALAALLILFVLPRGTTVSPGTAPTRTAAAAQDTVFVRFELRAPQARAVSVAGSFNNWNAATLPLVRDTVTGEWTATVALPVGEHRYQFVVDGTRWVPDPTAQSQVDDGFGGTNSVIVVGPKGLVKS